MLCNTPIFNCIMQFNDIKYIQLSIDSLEYLRYNRFQQIHQDHYQVMMR